MNVPVIPGAPLVALLVDRSGSMSTSLDEMETGLNEFIAEQASLPTPAALMLAQFDSHYEIMWPLRPIRGAPRYRLNPRGQTALHDAIGNYIGDVSDTLAAEATYRPVVMAVVTDGLDNASKEWDVDEIREWIQRMRVTYHWTFVFLGANLDAEAQAAKYGIPLAHALTFDVKHGKSCYQMLSRHVAEVRAGKQAAFSNTDRRKAIGQ